MTLEQIKDKIRSLPPKERFDLYCWLDYQIATDSSSQDFCSRRGTDRSLEIRRSLERNIKRPSRIESNSCRIQALQEPGRASP
jgi:hypothetical protein